VDAKSLQRSSVFGKATVFPAPVTAADLFLADLLFLDLFLPGLLFVALGLVGSASAGVVAVLSSAIDKTNYISLAAISRELV